MAMVEIIRVSTANAIIMPTIMMAIIARRGICTPSGMPTAGEVVIAESDVVDGWGVALGNRSIVSVISIIIIDVDIVSVSKSSVSVISNDVNSTVVLVLMMSLEVIGDVLLTMDDMVVDGWRLLDTEVVAFSICVVNS